MTPPDPARYADGRLDPASRRAFDPDPPTRAEWKRVSDGIALRVLPTRRTATRRGRRATVALALAASLLAAVLLWGRGGAPTPIRPPAADVANASPVADPDPLAEFAVLPVATPEELQVAALRGDWSGGLVASLDPLQGDLELATVDEVVVVRTPAGMEPELDFGDIPMVLGVRSVRTGE